MNYNGINYHQSNNNYHDPRQNRPSSGMEYFIKGWSLAFNLGIKRFIFLPLLANIVIMSVLFYWFFSVMTSMVA